MTTQQLKEGTVKKILRIGTQKTHGERYASVYAKVELNEGHLSITGVVGPLTSGNALGNCGQIKKPTIDKFAPGWDQDLLDTFFEVWKRYHLNDLRPGCEHQRALGWENHWQAQGWLPHTEGGLLEKPCPICGYKFGSAWNVEAIPDWVTDWLAALPDADRQPAWI